MLSIQRASRVIKGNAVAPKRWFGSHGHAAVAGPSPAVSSVSLTAQRATAPVTSQPTADLSAAPPAESSLWTKWFGKPSKYKTVPLDQVYPSAPTPTSTTLPQLDPDAHVTTLPNGLRVVTKAHFSPISSIGVFIHAGSRYEPSSHLIGLPHFFEFLALKSTKNRSDFQLIRDLQKDGANILMSSQREHMIYVGDVARHSVPSLVGTLADLIQNHAFIPQEIEHTKAIYEQDVIHGGNIDLLVSEAVHEAAYSNNTFGYPLTAPAANLHNFDSATLANFVKSYFTPKRMVITGVGVDHGELVDLVSRAFTELPADSIDVTSRQPAQYTGGEVRLHQRGHSGPAHFALAFEGASWHSADLVPMCLLQAIMGGGGSFSSGVQSMQRHAACVM